MQAPSAAQLLSVWERGVGLPPAQRAVLLLAAAHPAASVEEVAHLPVGRRDAGLLALREQLFGPRLVGRATCPACGAPLELAFNVADIRAAAPPELVEPLTIQAGGYEIAFRLPTGQDLIALAEGTGDDPPAPGCWRAAWWRSGMRGRRAPLQRCRRPWWRSSRPAWPRPIPRRMCNWT